MTSSYIEEEVNKLLNEQTSQYWFAYGDIISTFYFEGLVKEINEMIQEVFDLFSVNFPVLGFFLIVVLSV